MIVYHYLFWFNYLHGISSFFHFEPICVFRSKVRLFWTAHSWIMFSLSTLPISAFWRSNPFTFNVITYKEGHLLFCYLCSVCLIDFFGPSFPPLLLSFMFSWFFCSDTLWFPSHFLLCIFIDLFFMVTMTHLKS